MTPLAQQDPVQQATGGGGITIQLPTIDLTKIIPDLVAPFLAKLAQLVADVFGQIWQSIIGSGLNVITRTAPEWLYNQKDVADLATNLMAGIDGITALAVVLAGVGLIGREFWGWSWGPVEAAKNIALGVVYGSSAIRLCTWSINLVDSVNNGLGGVQLTQPPQVLVTGSPLDLIVSAVLAIPWFICGLWLWMLMAERLGMLALLFVVAPVFLGLWGIPQARGWTALWVRLWVGWLIGQPLALICLKFAAAMAGLFGGGSTAVLFGIVMLLVARKAATLFVAGGHIQDWGGTTARLGMAALLRR